MPAGGSGAAGYYVVTAVDSGGTESVQSLAVKPASAMSSAGSSAGGWDVLSQAGQSDQLQPYLVIWLLVMLAIGVAVNCRRQASGIRRQAKQ